MLVVQWGGFEVRLDAFIEAMFPRLHKTPPANWRRFPFRARKKLFRDLATEYTTQLFPNETSVLRDVAAKAGDLYWRRNAVAHGYIVITPEPNPSGKGHVPHFVAKGSHKGREVEIPLDKETLEKLRHDVSHLGGKLMASISRMGGQFGTGSPELVIADTELLQGPPHGSFRFFPMPNIRQSRLEPFRASEPLPARFVEPWKVKLSGTPSGN